MDRGVSPHRARAASASRSSSWTSPARARLVSGSRRAASATPTCTSCEPATTIRCRCCSATRAPASSRPSARESNTFAAGDRVVVGWRSPCGVCRWCQRGAEHLCRTPPRRWPADAFARRARALTGVSRAGTFATRTVVHGASLVRLPVKLPPEQACLIGLRDRHRRLLGAEDRRTSGKAPASLSSAAAPSASRSIQGAAHRRAPRRSTRSTSTSGSSRRRAASARRTQGTPRPSGSTSSSTSSGGRETVAQGLAMLGHAGTLVYIGLPQPGAEATSPLRALFDRRAADPRLARRRPRPGGRLPAPRASCARRRPARPRRHGHQADHAGRRGPGVRGHGVRRGGSFGDPPVRLPPPVAELIGIQVVETGAGTCTMKLEAGEQHSNPMGTIHGGILCDLADAAMGMAFFSTLERGRVVHDARVEDELPPAVLDGQLVAHGVVISRGKTVGHGRVPCSRRPGAPDRARNEHQHGAPGDAAKGR